MNYKSQLFKCLVSFALYAGAIQSSSAAEITRSNDPLCLIELSGEIVEGDHERFKALADTILPGFDGETTKQNTLCLNSPGGSLSEGTAIASDIYEKGITTVLKSGDSCYSACAIMFIMGKVQGAEMGWSSRKMHKDAKLGFHRPFLDIQSNEQISVKALAFAYDQAQENLLKIFSLANNPTGPFTTRPMMKSDLVKAMIAHEGNDFFMIDDVNKAGRFDIEVFGYEEPKGIDQRSAFMACDNAYFWETRVIDKNNADYIAKEYSDQEAVSRQSRVLPSEFGINFNVTSTDASYADASCNVRLIRNTLMICGYNETYDIRLGSEKCDPTLEDGVYNEVSKLALWPAYTKLASLPDKVDATNALQGQRYKCVVKSDAGQILDEEICVRGEVKQAAGFLNVDFVWPSGSKTVISIGKKAFRINGASANRRVEGTDTVCMQNEVTKNWFCTTKL
ncbi:hypothetical protein [Brucella gallinifaecis]|uniref:hypothetical protein n=1 Tax=Brucella gallinifaecis TaxID=215590 RepID=UPI002360D6DD|nr:hypothetical protein [Brucella gallinifaecis]